MSLLPRGCPTGPPQSMRRLSLPLLSLLPSQHLPLRPRAGQQYRHQLRQPLRLHQASQHLPLRPRLHQHRPLPPPLEPMPHRQ